MELDLTHLRSFVEVAERGTVAGAAESLGYTAPAVSQHVSKLERSLDSILFDRAGGRLVLTDAGRRVLPLAHQLLDLARSAREVVHSLPARPHVVMAGLASALTALITPCLATLSEQASIEVIEAEDGASLRELRLGHVDLALIQEYPNDPRHRDLRLDYTVVLIDELRLVLPPSFPSSTTLVELSNPALAGERHRYPLRGGDSPDTSGCGHRSSGRGRRL